MDIKAKKYKYVLFDLDGTINDSEPGIFASIRHALASFGINDETDENLRRMIGPPLRQSFMEYYGFDEQKTLIALEKYREYYADKGIFENSVYDGIYELLAEMKEAGLILILATSKPDVFAKRLLTYFDIEKFFFFISAGDLEQKYSEKETIIRNALTENHITDLSQTIMIGDRKFDINGAVRCGIDSIGVLYGYGNRKELIEAKATYIVEKVQSIKELLL